MNEHEAKAFSNLARQAAKAYDYYTEDELEEMAGQEPKDAADRLTEYFKYTAQFQPEAERRVRNMTLSQYTRAFDEYSIQRGDRSGLISAIARIIQLEFELESRGRDDEQEHI